MFYYINLFFLCSFLGFCMESFLKYVFFPSMNNGILFGPWIPIYGFGGVIIVFILRYVIHHFKVSSFVKMIITVLSVTVLLTFLEWVGGNFIEVVFHQTFWSYEDLKFHIGPYIALEISCVWGLMSILFIYLIKPLEELLIKKIPKWLTIVVSFIFLCDVVFTFVSKIK